MERSWTLLHFKSFLIKWIMILAVLWIVLGWFYGVSFTDILITSVVLTVVAYVADVYMLQSVGNVFAAIIDFIMAMAIIWLIGSYLYEEPISLGTASFISAFIITIGDLLFHRYMKNQIGEQPPTTKEEKGYYQQTDLRTEFGSEVDVDAAKKEKTDKEKNMNKSKNQNKKK